MFFAFASLLLSFILAPQAPPTARPWDVPFSANTAAIALAARNVTRTGNHDVIMLLESHRYTVDADGRSDFTLRKVYRILTEDGIEDWATIKHSYQPWFQQTPVLRARVIAPDGSVRALDLKTVADSPTLQFDSTIFSDDREIQAPLPNVVKDSVIEYEITIREKMPMLDAGVVHDIRLNDLIPVERFHLEIDADARAPLKVSSRLLPADGIKRTPAGRRVRLEADFGPLETREGFLLNLPYDEPQTPYIGFSTAQSWQAIAARYDGIVNQRLAGADVRGLLADTNLTAPPQEVAANLTAILHQKVRYTGIEFGDAAIIPGPPAQTIQRGYGDCKDKSALLVAMLRAAGLPASIALLRSGFDTDIDRALPGMGVFDHAIVYVATNPPIWIDATADDFRVPSLPAADQGRLALIANAQTVDLVRTPEGDAKDNWRREDLVIRMKDYGNGSIQETMTAGGSMEAEARKTFDGADTKLREKLEKLVKEG